MEEREIQGMLRAGETSVVEFKESIASLDEIKKIVTAFANDWQRSGSGIVLIGVNKRGEAIGMQCTVDEALRKLANSASDGSIDPKPQTIVEHFDLNGRIVAIVRVPAGQRPPYRWNGKAYIRIGTQTRATSSEEDQELLQRSLTQTPEPLPGWLPPREEVAPDFVGREHELAELWRWFLHPDFRRCALVGQGGSGKTALAYQFACSVRSRAPRQVAELVLWISAKRRRLQEEQIVPIKPDFSDLETALNALLVAAGFEEYAEIESIDEKRKQLLEILKELPALIVADDLDTLQIGQMNQEAVAAVDFLIFTVPASSASKVLVSSRADPVVGFAIPVNGFDPKSQEGLEFVESRLSHLRMPKDVLTKGQKTEVVKESEGVILYVEDFLRLFKVNGDLRKTLSDWIGLRGERAREFALKVEFEHLSAHAKIVLSAFAELGSVASFEDVKAVTNLGEAAVEKAVLELQHLFLLSSPMTVGDGAFAINENTRRLVRSVLSEKPELMRIRNAIKGIKGGVYSSYRAREQVASYIRKAVLKVKESDFDSAEGILRQALDGSFPEHPDLFGMLGFVHKVRRPRSAERARQCFRRAAELGGRQFETYRHWVEMELDEGAWSSAIQVAEMGLGLLGSDGASVMLLKYYVGYAKSRLGKTLIEGYNEEKGLESLRESHDVLADIVKDPEELQPGEWSLHSKVYLAMVLNAETYYRTTKDKRWGNRIPSLLEKWASEHAEDARLLTEGERLRRRYPELQWRRQR